MFKRRFHTQLIERLREPRRFLQVLAGARQTGKTTLVRQALADLPGPNHYVTADEPALKDRHWIEQHWQAARQLTRQKPGPPVLVIDEIQKIPGW
ncbi:MAG: AAA family ATPase [Planctomycetota bacterium]|nr:AAA family ATPase [Planctomycetota bacterium]